MCTVEPPLSQYNNTSMISPDIIVDQKEVEPGPCRTKMSVKWEMLVGIGVVVIVLGLFFCLIIFKKARLKKKASVKPMEKRTLLKTANYTVNHSWDQLVVKFHSQPFFKAFFDALTLRYQKLKAISTRGDTEGAASSSSGEPVWLKILKEPRILIVTDKGNNSWIFNDFQNICKNLTVLDDISVSSGSLTTNNGCLQPRLPTIGEVITDAGDHIVKDSATGTEIRFTQSGSFTMFKEMLHTKYPDISWSKYRERQCAQVQTGSSGTLTVHVWEGSQTVWLCGPGRRDWYYSEFKSQENTQHAEIGIVSESTDPQQS